MRSLSTFALFLVALSSLHAGGVKESNPLPDVKALGEVVLDKDVLAAKSQPATLVIGAPDKEFYRVTAEIQLAPKVAANYVEVFPEDPRDFKKPAAFHLYFTRDAAGQMLQTGSYSWDAKTKQWGGNKDIFYMQYWPAAKQMLNLLDPKQAPQKWHGRWLPVRVEADRHYLSFWLDGRLITQVPRASGQKGPVAFQLAAEDRIRKIEVTSLEPDRLFVPVDLSSDVNDRFEAAVGKAKIEIKGVPFELTGDGKEHLSLRRAGWIEVKTDPADYYEWYDNGPPILHDPRMPFLRVPLADYMAAHLLAVADDDPATVPKLTLRAGRYGYSEQVVQHDFPGSVPRKSEASKVDPSSMVKTSAGPLFHVRVPMTKAIAQDLQNFLEIELTKEIHLARRQPDPNRFRLRPLGLPSGVRVAALTLERSPLQMRVTSKESGHAFEEPGKPTFQVRLHNIAAGEQPYKLVVSATHQDGTKTETVATGKVPANQTIEPAIVVPTSKRGLHTLVVSLEDGSGRVLLERHTTFAVLPPDTRKHRAQSPFGTWDFCGTHFTVNDPDHSGPLYVKLGLRFGMSGFKPEQRAKYGVAPSTEPVTLVDAKNFESMLKSHPDLPLIGLIFHEHGISGKHLTRVPDLFHDRPRYQLDDAEKKQLQKMWDEALAGARDMRAKLPKVHLRLGNGALPTQEELLRKKFPSELFDSLGNECPSFGRFPEAQPPDCVAFNSSLWMQRQMLDAYGYKDKPVSACYELLYPACNPGNLTLEQQSDYLVRHALHGLAWGLPEIKLGCICDMGNSYLFSNWGATGFCFSKPELNVKPAFVAFATLTRVLDGAKFVRVVPFGSPSVYCMEFRRPDGSHAFALWTVRGKRPVKLHVAAGAWKIVNKHGEEAEQKGNAIEVVLSPSPVYVVGKLSEAGPSGGGLSKIETGTPTFEDAPAGKVASLAPLADLSDWSIEPDANMELDYYDFMCPRRKGDFEITPAAGFEGKEPALKMRPRSIKHGKDTMPMYAVLAHKKGIAVPGKPSEIGLWVNGNSGWGRVIFELQDASGQRWISLGAQQSDLPQKTVEEMIPKEALAKFAKPGMSDWNTEDVFGLSRINFDGWRYVGFPLPGNYIHENYPWPANSQWRGDKDGIVHYPLTFKKLIVELNEKVLHVKTWSPPPRAEIYLRDLVVWE